jgi:DNA sulfur modification protein DndC
VYNPLTEIPNEEVWKFLLKGDAISPWGSDNKYLFSLYQGENLGEEASVIGEIDKEKIPVTGHSRFGCWICTMVKEDKSLKAFIDRGETWLEPLRDFRNWLIELRATPYARETKRRNGQVYVRADGGYGMGPFTMAARVEILRHLLQLEETYNFELITLEELKYIDKTWDEEGDLSRRTLVDLYYEIKKKHLPWDDYKVPVFSEEVIDEIKKQCEENNVEFELISKLIVEIEANKNYTKGSRVTKAFDRIINQGWLHFETIQKGLNHEDQ